jgi:hypothetical protein
MIHSQLVLALLVLSQLVPLQLVRELLASLCMMVLG